MRIALLIVVMVWALITPHGPIKITTDEVWLFPTLQSCQETANWLNQQVNIQTGGNPQWPTRYPKWAQQHRQWYVCELWRAP